MREISDAWRGSGAYLFMSSGTTGQPKIGLQPRHQHIPEILQSWNPTSRTSGRRFVDFSSGGKAWSANHFFRELCLSKGMIYLHLGNVANDLDLDAIWGRVLLQSEACVISGNPTLLEIIASYVVKLGRDMPTVQAVLWTGEPLKGFHERAITRAFPNAELWSVYGGTEPWVIGFQTPEMPRNQFRALDYQYVELVDGSLVVTSLNEAVINPMLRYKVPDLIEAVDQTADGRILEFKVLGRADNRIFFDGNNVSPRAIAQAVRRIRNIEDSQVILRQRDGVVKRIEIRIRPQFGAAEPSHDDVLKALIEDDVQNDVLREILSVDSSEPFVINDRSGKCADYVFLDF
ncbi:MULTISPECIES: AMP-binding protein [unclassified Bradyrhizobium]|uniref:AMP-binding protein n=1 Tax=Bradyrhizobium TaxID=374 RepID=UPI0028E58C19|nr:MULTISPECIES: AMP-binding protein [unclassified Bradyrhizobium]